MALALEGTPVHKNSSGSSSEVMGAFTTSQAAQIFLSIAPNDATVSSVSGGGLTWARRATSGGTSPIELWSAQASGALSGVSFTINFSVAPTFDTMDVFAFSGQDTTTIWDSHASVPTTGTSDPLAISTNNANDVIIAIYREAGTSTPTQGAGFTKISGADFALVEYKIVAATQSSLSCTQGTGAGNANGGVVDALMAASGGGGSTLSSTVGSVSGVGTLVGVTNTIKNAVGNSTGLGTAVGVSQVSGQTQTVGTSTGLGTAVGVSNTVANAVGNSAGVGAAVGVTNTITNAVGNASGTVSVVGVGLAIQPGQMVGNSNGIATVSGVAVTIVNAVGNASGISDAQGVNDQVVISNQIGVIVGAGGELTWRDHVKAIHDKRMLEGRIREEQKELKKVEKKLKTVAKKIESKEKPEGILATYLELELKKDEIENKIQALEIDLEPLIMAIRKSEIEEDDKEFMSLQ
jgi:hypothetical protein